MSNAVIAEKMEKNEKELTKLVGSTVSVSGSHAITNSATFYNYYSNLTGCDLEDLDKEAVIESVRQSLRSHEEFYVTADHKLQQSYGDYCFVPLHINDKTFSLPLYLMLFRTSQTFSYKGNRVTTLSYACRMLCENKDVDESSKIRESFKSICSQIENPETAFLETGMIDSIPERVENPTAFSSPGIIRTGRIENYEQVVAKTSSMVDDVWDRLLVNPFETKGGLKLFFHQVGRRIADIYNEKDQGYVLRNSGNGAAVNTGLLDKFAAPVVLYYEKARGTMDFVPVAILDSKEAFVKKGFAKEALNDELPPITLVNRDEAFDAAVSDVDLPYRSLVHMIEERFDRIPEEMADLPATAIATRIEDSIRTAVKMHEVSKSFVKPYYSVKTGLVSYAVPVFSFESDSKEPVLVVILAKSGGFYTAKTILPYSSETRDKIKGSNLYASVW